MIRPFVPFAASAVLLAACSGSAVAATQTWQITDIAKIRVDGPFDVQVHTGKPSGVRATGPQSAIDHLVVEQQGDTLLIHPARTLGGGWGWSDRQPLVVEVGTHSLVAAVLTGSGAVRIDRMAGDSVELVLSGSGDLTADAVDSSQARLTVTGSGDLTVAGRARGAAARLTGSGDLHADKLAAYDATVDLIGSGNLGIGAIGTAAVTLGGSGDVAIAGPARCTVKRTGSGNVHCGHVVFGVGE